MFRGVVSSHDVTAILSFSFLKNYFLFATLWKPLPLLQSSFSGLPQCPTPGDTPFLRMQICSFILFSIYLTVFGGIFGALECFFFGASPRLVLFNNFVTDLFGVFLGLYVTVFVRKQDKEGAISLCKKQTNSYLCLESKNDKITLV